MKIYDKSNDVYFWFAKFQIAISFVRVIFMTYQDNDQERPQEDENNED